MNNRSKNIVEFTLIYNRYKTKIYNYVLRMVNDNEKCEDIVQSVFLKFFENMERIINIDSSKYWLFTTARNEVYSYYRKQKVKTEELFGEENLIDNHQINYDLEDKIELKELKSIILHQLKKFPQEQREVYLLKEYGELSYKEIAKATNTNEELVKSRLYKTRQKLMKQISKILGPELK